MDRIKAAYGMMVWNFWGYTNYGYRYRQAIRAKDKFRHMWE